MPMSRLLQINKIVGQPVTKKSKAADLSQQEVAGRTNLNTEGIGPIQRGVTPPKTFFTVEAGHAVSMWHRQTVI